jgi:hypothetical protein
VGFDGTTASILSRAFNERGREVDAFLLLGLGRDDHGT